MGVILLLVVLLSRWASSKASASVSATASATASPKASSTLSGRLVSIVSLLIKVEASWIEFAMFPLVAAMDLAYIAGVLFSFLGCFLIFLGVIFLFLFLLVVSPVHLFLLDGHPFLDSLDA